MNILLVDDHELFRSGIKFLLADLADDVTYAEASDCASALAEAPQGPFDIVLLDLYLPGVRGLEALRAIRDGYEDAAIVVLSAESDPSTIRRAIEEGASGFIPKNASHKVMIAALNLVLAGGTYLPPDAVIQGAPPALDGVPGGTLADLSDRQLQTLRLAIRGMGNKLIAREMSISEATVKAHLTAAYRVLGVQNRTGAVFAAARKGLRIA